jgi:hypothetical protein
VEFATTKKVKEMNIDEQEEMHRIIADLCGFVRNNDLLQGDLIYEDFLDIINRMIKLRDSKEEKK